MRSISCDYSDFRVIVHVVIGNLNTMHMRLQNGLSENPAIRMVEVLMNSIESFRGMLWHEGIV